MDGQTDTLFWVGLVIPSVPTDMFDLYLLHLHPEIEVKFTKTPGGVKVALTS
jgi:hypothetical protein